MSSNKFWVVFKEDIYHNMVESGDTVIDYKVINDGPYSTADQAIDRDVNRAPGKYIIVRCSIPDNNFYKFVQAALSSTVGDSWDNLFVHFHETVKLDTSIEGEEAA